MTISTIALLRYAGLGSVLIVSITTIKDWSLFSLHPICMTLFLYLSSEGAAALSKKNKRSVQRPAAGSHSPKLEAASPTSPTSPSSPSLPNNDSSDSISSLLPSDGSAAGEAAVAAAAAADRVNRNRNGGSNVKKVPRSKQIDSHANLVMAGFALGIVGFCVEYYVKASLGKPHFSTTHGFIGSLTVLYALAQSVIGYLNRTYLKIKFGWVIHRLSGGFLIALISYTCLLHVSVISFGMYERNWMIKHEFFPGWGLLGTLCLGVVGVANLVRSALE